MFVCLRVSGFCLRLIVCVFGMWCRGVLIVRGVVVCLRVCLSGWRVCVCLFACFCLSGCVSVRACCVCVSVCLFGLLVDCLRAHLFRLCVSGCASVWVFVCLCLCVLVYGHFCCV